MKLSAAIIVMFSFLSTLAPGAETASVPIRSVDNPPRVFADQAVSRFFEYMSAGQAQVTWRTQVQGELLEEGARQIQSNRFSVVVHLPAVRSRMEITQKMSIVGMPGETACTFSVFPRDILAALSAETAALPPIGVVDLDGKFAARLQEAGLTFSKLETPTQVALLQSKIVLVAPGSESSDEMYGGIAGMIDGGGTVIFLEPAPAFMLIKSGFAPVTAPPIADQRAASASLLADGTNPIMSGLKPEDLSNWGGSGSVAERSWVGDGPLHDFQQRVWMMGTNGLPALTEYWKNGKRGIICHLKVATLLTQEPAAQVLLRNLIVYARTTPVPESRRVIKLLAPAEAVAGGKFNVAALKTKYSKDELATAEAQLILLPTANQNVDLATLDLPKFLAKGGRMIVQSPCRADALAAVNALVKEAWGDEPLAPIPQWACKPLEPAAATMNYTRPITWGIASSVASSALDGAATTLDVKEAVPGVHAIVTTGQFQEFDRDRSHIILCAMPLAADEHGARELLLQQLTANLIAEPTLELTQK